MKLRLSIIIYLFLLTPKIIFCQNNDISDSLEIDIEVVYDKLYHPAKTEVDYLFSGDSLLKNGKVKEAINFFTKIIAMNKYYLAPYLSRARALLIIGNIEAATNDINFIFSRDNENPIAYDILGDIHMERKAFKKAVKAYGKSLQIYPISKELYYKRGQAYHNLGKYRYACKDWSKAAKLGYNKASLILDKHCK